MSGSADPRGLRVAPWGAGGLGLRAGLPADDPPWRARAARPLLLIRRAGDEATEETFGFHEVSIAPDGALSASAAVSDTRGARWDVRLAARPAEGGGTSGTLRWTLGSGDGAGVFVGHTLDLLADPADLYVCLPGSVYDGNDISPDHKGIPRVSRTGVLEYPTSSLAYPCACFYARSSGASIVLASRQRAATRDGAGLSTGLRYDARNPARLTVSVTAPLWRTELYRLGDRGGEFHFHFLPVKEAGATLAPGDWIELPVAWFGGIDEGVVGLFKRIHSLRPFFRAGHRRKPLLPLSEAAALVGHNQDRYHWQEDKGFYANATEVDGRNANQLLTGWGSGIITGYGLLACGDEQSRGRARQMLDFIAATAVSPSGLFYGCYQDGTWDQGPALRRGERNDKTYTPWHHIRTAEDGTLYLLRACRLEERRGQKHPSWRAAVQSNLDAFARLWERHGEFGREVDRATGEITVPGSAAGALCIACLAEGSQLFGEQRYLAAAREAADSYHARFIETGHTTGGPLDILGAADSESCLMFPCSFMAVYERTGERRFLGFAEEAADQLASWVLAWDGTFPTGSTLDRLGVQTIGGVIANAQNHHIGPGGASTSLSSLLALYRATGEARFLRLLEDHATALAQYLSRYDGQIDRLAKGMMSEQINLADAMNHAQGEIWNISASWSANNVLLARAELPGIYVDPGRRELGVFDHVEVAADWDAGTLRVANPTSYTAKTTIQVENRPARDIELAQAQAAVVRLAGGT